MSVQFVIGNSGSGKSTYLYEHVIEASMAHPEKRFFFIVPEQFTMSTQRTFVTMHPDHTIMNIDVLSFHRLAYRIFTELGLDHLSVLDDTGKNLIMHRIAALHPEEFPILGKKLKRPGYIDEMKSLISEFTQYHISPEDLLKMGETSGMPPIFQGKTKEISFMYESFLEFIKDSHITSEQILETLSQVIGDSSIMKDSVVVFDGFTGFTPLQNDVVEELMKITDQILISVILDPKDEPYYTYEEHELFAMSKKFMAKVLQLAKNSGCDVLEPVLVSLDASSRFTPDSVFGYLEQHLFRQGDEKWEKDSTSNLLVYRLENPRNELEYCANKIRSLAKNHGYRYSDIAIVCSDISSYKNYITEIFPKYDIPVFTDASMELSYQPAIEFVLSFLEVMDKDYSYESVMHFLRTGLLPFSMEEIDLFDSYLYRSGTRGKKRYSGIFTVRPKEFSDEEMLSINSIREKLYALLKEATEIFTKDTSVEEKSKELRNLFLLVSMEEQMEQKADAYLEMGEDVKSQEYRRIYTVILELLEKFDHILGQEKVSAREYSDMLRAGFSGTKMGVIPPLMDGVVFGDLERTRLENIKVLFLVGAVDGLIPKVSTGSGILSQNERSLLKDADYELAPTQRERSFMQRFYLYQILTKASDLLIVTYARLDSEGVGVRKSYIVSELQELFPDLTIKSFDESLLQHGGLVTLDECKKVFISLCHELQKRGSLEGEALEMFSTLLAFFDREHKEELEDILQGVFYRFHQDGISKAVAHAMNGKDLYVSVSKLEKYAQCAYQYFLRYGLRLQERREHAFESYDIGNIYHEALNRFSMIVSQQEGSWAKVSDEHVNAYIEQAIEETYGAMEKTEIYDLAREVYVLHRMRETLKRTVWAIMRQVRQGSYEPKKFEVSLGEISNLASLTYELNNDARLHLDGTIDRLDTYENDEKVYVKIIDYKSGNKTLDIAELYYGLQIQLVFYMGAAVEGLQQSYGDKKVVPGAMLYYHLDNPFVEQVGSDEEVERALLRALRPKGGINASDEAINAIDRDIVTGDDSDVAVLKRNKDGSWSKNSEVLTEEEFEVMTSFVRQKALQTGEDISNGKIDVLPYKKGDKSGCDYCPYKGICGFDSSLEGYDYQKMDGKLKPEDAFVWMKEKLNRKGEEDA